MMSNKYTLNSSPFGTHNLIARELGENKLILDVGCSGGYLKLLTKNNIFYGIDNDSESLSKALALGYVKIFEIDLQNNFSAFNCDKEFDTIVLADILEHLIYPDKVLNFFTENYLKKNGEIIISLPNVANFFIRLSLLLGKFNYTESGILDKTHLHLYTKKTARDLIQDCNLKIIKEKFSSNRFGKIIKIFPFLGGLLGFNLIFICEKKY